MEFRAALQSVIIELFLQTWQPWWVPSVYVSAIFLWISWKLPVRIQNTWHSPLLLLPPGLLEISSRILYRLIDGRKTTGSLVRQMGWRLIRNLSNSFSIIRKIFQFTPYFILKDRVCYPQKLALLSRSVLTRWQESKYLLIWKICNLLTRKVACCEVK